MKTFENESGIFYADNQGKLLRYVSSRKNLWQKEPCPRICSLYIPDGIRELPDGAFSGYQVEYLTIPPSLEKLGERVFSGSHIGAILLLDPAYTSKDLLRQLVRRLRFAFFWDDGKLLRPLGEEYLDIYRRKDEKREDWQEIQSVGGTFWIASDGFLVDFRPKMDDDYSIHRLHIPEGVQGISEGLFENIRVREELVLPRSLRYIGKNVFHHCVLPEVVLPENLEILDCYAFGRSIIRSVTIAHGFGKKLLPQLARQFKDCCVEEYRVPVRFRELLKAFSPDRGYETYEVEDPDHGRLFCVRNVDRPMGWGNETMNLILEYIKKVN